MPRQCLAGWLVVVALALPAPVEGESLAERFAAITGEPRFANADWGILIVDTESGAVVHEHQADKLFAPASTTKLFSVAAALDALGADYRFRTPVRRRGEVDGAGVLAGDLILVATGDLTLGGRATTPDTIAFTNHDHTYASIDSATELTTPDPLAGLDDLARQVRAAGIRKVVGEVLVDDRLFEQIESTGSGPARVTPIRVNDNLLDFTVRPKAAGQPALVEWRPHTAAYSVDAQIDTVATGEKQDIRARRVAPGRLILRGQIAADSKPVTLVQEVEDPARFARALFIEALGRAGVEVAASPLDGNPADQLPPGDQIDSLPVVATHVSAPFAESAKLILKVSHNLAASTLPLLVATHHGKRTLREGLELEGEFLKRVGVAAETISFGGGAGGSPADFTTPRATVQLLVAMKRRPDFSAYFDALPILGVDGTLSDAVGADNPARGAARGKTGTYFQANLLSGGFLLTSKALAGYVQTAKGRSLAFSFVVNGVHLKNAAERSEIGRTLGRLCAILHEAL